MSFDKDYAGYYDLFYQDKDYQAECDFIEKIFERYSCEVKNILDLGCGTGGHTLILARRGYSLTGVDKSDYMINLAKKKSEKSSEKIEYLNVDITQICLNKTFDAVVAMFAVISYQNSNKLLSSVFEVAKKSLKKKGIFLFDCWHGPGVLWEPPERRIKELNLSEKERVIRFAEPELDELDHLVRIKYRILKVKNEKILNEIEEVHTMRFFFPQEIKKFLQAAGFKSIECYPLFNMDRCLDKHDWQMMVVAR